MALPRDGTVYGGKLLPQNSQVDKWNLWEAVGTSFAEIGRARLRNSRWSLAKRNNFSLVIGPQRPKKLPSRSQDVAAR